MSRLAHPAPESAQAGALSHQSIWDALDALAARHGMSPSGLAKRAGLDATTFNRSKRRTNDGRLRWPSTESIAKVLDATGSDLSEFFGLGAARPKQTLRCVSMQRLRQDATAFDEAGQPSGEGWGETSAPDLAGSGAFVVELSDDQLAPAYRKGDLLIFSPKAFVQRGDRVLAKPRGGAPVIAEFLARSGGRVEMRGLDAEARQFAIGDVEWIARVIWRRE